jgi:hypothetical protein
MTCGLGVVVTCGARPSVSTLPRRVRHAACTAAAARVRGFPSSGRSSDRGGGHGSLNSSSMRPTHCRCRGGVQGGGGPEDEGGVAGAHAARAVRGGGQQRGDGPRLACVVGAGAWVTLCMCVCVEMGGYDVASTYNDCMHCLFGQYQVIRHAFALALSTPCTQLFCFAHTPSPKPTI